MNVIHHYKNDPLKSEAAKFLIANMAGHYAVKTELAEKLSPIYQKHREISELHQWERSQEWYNEIDSMRDLHRHLYFPVHNATVDFDHLTISAEWLIAQIDLAFEAWESNAYFKDCAPELFFEHILPYRAQSGLLLTDSRNTFYDRHNGFFSVDTVHFQNRIDSLLYIYKEIMHSNYAAGDLPILSTETVETIKRVLCAQRCWYNVQLLRSLGIPCAIDFVPNWGSMNSSHAWNVVVSDDDIYPFEAFWEDDRWKYKELYNNRSFDAYWGRFRLPKVFRETFSVNATDILLDERIGREDIPPLFRNVYAKDVSHQYFDTTNVTLKIDMPVPEDTYYAYLCVWNYGDWIPVQWGAIVDDKSVVFTGMGRDNIYMPALYKNNATLPFGDPFLLGETGEIIILKPDERETQTIVVHNHTGVANFYEENHVNYAYSKHARFSGSREAGDSEADFLCAIPERIDMYHTLLPVVSDKKYRYIRIKLEQDTVALNELVFYTQNGDKLQPIENIRILSAIRPIDPINTPDYIVDPYAATGCRGVVKNGLLEIDLGGEYRLSAIGFTPFHRSNLWSTATFEFCYWDNGWQSVERRPGNDSFYVFENIPSNTFYIIKNENRNSNDHKLKIRPFIYKRNEVLFK